MIVPDCPVRAKGEPCVLLKSKILITIVKIEDFKSAFSPTNKNGERPTKKNGLVCGPYLRF